MVKTIISKSKRSEMGFLATILLILLAAIVLITAITQFSKKAGLEGVVQACRFSILAQSYTEVKPSTSGWESPLDIECSTRYVTFKNTEVLAGLDPETQKPLDVYWDGKKVKRFANLNDQIVNQVIAEEMKICWFQFAEGKTNVFPNNENWFQASDDICFICSNIEFDLPQQKVYDGLYDFLSKTTIKKEGKTYLAYLSDASKSDATWDEFVKIDDNDELERIYGDDYAFEKINEKMAFDTSKTKQYAIVFRRDYDSAGIASVISIGAISDKDNYFIFVMPADKINEVCDLIAN